jgi:predicted O-methyltransferase YrrM
MIKAYLRYYFAAQTIYQVHSPFVYNWVQQVLDDYRQYYIFDKAEVQRARMLESKQSITVTDFGAGSRSGVGNVRKVAQIAKTAVTQQRQCELLFKTIQLYKPKTMLEIGTSLGIAAIYQAAGYVDGQLVSLEGCPNIVALAQRNLLQTTTQNATVITGEFSATLPLAFAKLKQLDYVFIDGNHRKTATLQYFEQCLAYAHSQTIFIFDDIHWSIEMEEAWQTIKNYPKVTLTIDIFCMGIVFIRPEQQVTEHFTLIELWQKPWLRFKL